MTLGTSSVTLNDTAVLSGGYYETGTITFTLYQGSTLVDTETVSVSGNGSYTTPTGYTLPTTGTVTGTYQWDSSYSGDTNNQLGSENNASAEQVTVSPASPTHRHDAQPSAVTLGSSSITISGTKYLDLTGNGFTSDDTPQSGVTIDLYQQVGSSVTLVATTTTAANGTYSFTVTPGHLLRVRVGAVGIYPDRRRAERERRKRLLHSRRHRAATAIPDTTSPTI